MKTRQVREKFMGCARVARVSLAAATLAAFTASADPISGEPADIRVAPLIEAKWAQGDVGDSPCYNSKTPQNCLCGCVATAAGQIMRKWRYPVTAAKKVTNTLSVNGVSGEYTMFGGPNGVSYDWVNMPFDPANEASLMTAQREAIGTLLYDIGVAAKMDYTTSSSGTSTSLMFEQFTDTFGYSNAAIAGHVKGTGLSLAELEQAVLPSLDAGMPVMFGVGGNMNHSIACDGYGYDANGNLLLHLNLGYATQSPAWYYPPTNNPQQNGKFIYDSNQKGTYLNPVVYNISPTMQKGWSIVSGRILSGGNAVEGAEVVAVNASGEGVATAASNAKGIYALALPAGAYTLRAVDSGETKGARVPVTVVATEGAARSDGGAENVVIGNQHGVDISLAEIGSDFFADETPDAYIDYVESSGSQHIDTGVRGRAGTKADIGMMWKGISDSSASDFCFLGARNGSDGRFLLCHAYKLGWNLGYKANWNSPSSTYTPTLPANNVHYAIMTEITSSGYFNFTVNGTPGGRDTTAQGTYNSGFTMYLFANHGTSSGSVANKCPSGTRCYWTKIWQTDESGAYKLVRDFVPCKKGGRAALYDKVTRTIFYSRSGTDLIASDYTISTVEEPDEFLDYVESDGNQYIDTGVEGRRGVKAMMDVAWTGFVDDTYQEILGAASSAGRCNLCDLYGAMPSYSYGENWGTFDSGLTSGRTIDTVYHVITEAAAKEVLTINGYTGVRNTASEVPENFTTGLNLYLFARNYNGSGDLNAKARLYYAKIWLDGVLVRDFVPCKKNGEPGLYDKETKSIFVSKGSKPLIAGPVSSVVEEPDEFLDYVESDGSQYIDTGVEGRRGVKAMMDVAWTGFADDTYQEILGAASSAGRCNLCDLYGAMPSYSYGENWGTFDSGLTSGRTIDTVYHVITEAAAKEGLTINGYTGVRNNASEVPENFTTGLNLYLFARNYNGSGDLNAKARLYYAKIWLDGVLVRDFVPCKKNGEPGLYDKVTKSIFYSKGTKPLIAGPLPGCPDEFLDYVESTGAQYVDTGVVGRDGTKAEIDFMLTAEPTSSSIVLLGADESDPWSGNKFYLLAIRGANKKFNDGYKARYNPISDTIPSANTRYRAIADVAVGGSFKTTWNGASATHDYTSNPGPYNIGLSLYLFTNNRNGTGGALSAKARCYGLKMWQTDTNGDYQLMCDFVPCKKDGVAGLWDRVTKKIFYSKTSTALVAGNTIAKVGQPDSFVEYVESDGTQYIDTGVIGKAGTKAEMTFSANESNGNPSFLLASKKDGQSYMNFCYFGKGLNVGFGSHYWDVAWDSYDRGKLYVLESEYSQDQKVSATLNGDPKSDNSTGSQDGVISLYAFARHELDGAVNGCCAKLFSLKIEQTDANGDYQPKRDFVPCVKDGKAALYDSITGMIYYPQGGDLTASEDEVPISSARWIGGTVTSVADLANTANWKGMQGGLVVYGKTPITVSGGEATLNCPVTLDEAADWSAAGIVSLASGVTIDLNGHDLTTGGFALAEGETVSILNSGTAATLTFAVADGNTAAVDVSFASNITFAKTGSGTVSLTPVKLALTVGSCFQFTGGIALDLSGTTLELADPENFTEGFVFATSDAAITGTPTAANLPNGWKVKRSADGKSLSIAKIKGLMIIAK